MVNITTLVYKFIYTTLVYKFPMSVVEYYYKLYIYIYILNKIMVTIQL